MKKLIPISFIFLLAACGSKEKESEAKNESETPKKVWMCDSIKESSFDAEGNEILTSKLHCDSVLQEPEKKHE
jgi:hypothetical protein